MLASPGHSPRHLPPLPELPNDALQEDPSSSLALLTSTTQPVIDALIPRPQKAGFIAPPPPKRAKKQPVVLEEDEFVAGIERIVERDFFPDIPRLQSKLEWMEAVRSGDPEQMRLAQANIAQRRALMAATARSKQRGSRPDSGANQPSSSRGAPSFTPSVLASPATGSIRVPGGDISVPPSPAGSVGVAPSEASLDRWELGSELGGDAEERRMWRMKLREVEAAMKERRDEGEGEREGVDLRVGLDTYLRKYTSEDNASFSAIQEKERKRRELKSVPLLMPPGTEAAVDAAVKTRQAITEGGDKGKGLVALAAPDRTGVSKAGESEGGRGVEETDGFGTTGQPVNTLKQWAYTARNSLMFSSAARPAAPFTAEERQQRSMGPPKEVRARNTRFHTGKGGSSSASEAGQSDASEAAAAAAAAAVAQMYGAALPGGTPLPYYDPRGAADSKYDLDDMRRTPVPAGGNLPVGGGVGGGEEEDGGGVGGAVGMDGRVYSYVATPSPRPGVDASPFMTWGDIASTPMRLDADDEDLRLTAAHASGPQFQMPARGTRDEAAHSMARTAGKSLRRRQEMKGVGSSAGKGTPGGGVFSPGLRSGGLTPGSVRGGGTPGVGIAGVGRSGGVDASPRGASLSAAAQRLVSKALKKTREAVDTGLRASYAASPSHAPSPSPVRRGGSGGTPSVKGGQPSPSPLASRKGR